MTECQLLMLLVYALLVIQGSQLCINGSCRDQEKKLRLGIRRAGIHEIGVPDSIIAKNYNSYNFLLPVADAISLMSKFHVFYCTRYES